MNTVRTPRKAPKLEAEGLYEYAVRILSVRTYSVDALRTKLKIRALRTPDVEAAIDRLTDVGYLNDARFAESLARYKIEGAGLGRSRVLNDLRTQRISSKVAEEAVGRAFENVNEAEMIDAYIERRLPALKPGVPVDDQKVLLKAYNRLRRAGFASGPAFSAIKRRAAQPEILEEPDEDETAE